MVFGGKGVYVCVYLLFIFQDLNWDFDFVCNFGIKFVYFEIILFKIFIFK